MKRIADAGGVAPPAREATKRDRDMAFVSRSSLEKPSMARIGATTRDPMALVLLAAIYVKVYFSFSPFKRGPSTNMGEGSPVNQIYWLSIFAFGCWVLWRNRVTAIELLRRTWFYLIPLIWFAITILWSPEFDTTLRRTVLIFLMMIVALGVSAGRPSQSDFMNVSVLVLGSVLLFNVLSVFLVPQLAVKGGNFLGIYTHKNGAGYVGGIIFIFLFFYMMSTARFEVKIIALFASMVGLFFLVGTHSKTSLGLGLLVPVIGIALYYVLRLELQWRVMAYVAGSVLMGILAWIVFYIDWTLDDIGMLVFEDLTFTNRTNVWQFVIKSIEERPILGHGYAAFWKTEEGLKNRLGAQLSDGWAATAGSAHNGYLNIWLETGLVGLVLCVAIAVIVLHGALHLMKRSGESYFNRWVYASVFALTLFVLLRDLMEASLYQAQAGSTMLFFVVSYLVVLWRWQGERRPVYDEPSAQGSVLSLEARSG